METTDYQQKKLEKSGETQYVNKRKLENENYTATELSVNTGREMVHEQIEFSKNPNVHGEKNEIKNVRGINAIVADTSESAKHDHVKNVLVNLKSVDGIKIGNTKDFKKSPTLIVVPDDNACENSKRRCDSQPERPSSSKGLPADESLTEESKDCSDQKVKPILVPSGVKYNTGLVMNRYHRKFKSQCVKRKKSDDRIHTSLEESKISNDDKVQYNTENCSPQGQSKDESETSVQESIHPSEIKTDHSNSLLSRDSTSRSPGGCDESHEHHDPLTIDRPEEQTYEGNGKCNSCAVTPELNVQSSHSSEKSVSHEVVPEPLPTRNPTFGEIEKSHDDGKFIDLKSKQFSKRSLPKDNGYCYTGTDLRWNPARNKRHLPSLNKEEADFFRCYIGEIIFIICCLFFCQKDCMKQKKYLCGARRAVKNKTIKIKVIDKEVYRKQPFSSLCKLTLCSDRRSDRVIVILALPYFKPSLHEIRNILNDTMYRESCLRDHGFRLATFSTTANNIEGTLKLASHGFFCDTDGKIKCSECGGEYTSAGIADQELQSAHRLGCSCRHFVGPVGNSIQDTYGSQAPEILLYGIRRENQCQIEGVVLRDDIGGGVQQQDGTTDENDSHEIEGNSLPLLTQIRSVEIIDLQMDTKFPNQDQDGMNEYFTIHQRQQSQYIHQEATHNVAMSTLPTEYSPPTSSSLASDDRRDNCTAESRAGATSSSYTSNTHSAPVSNAAIDMQQQSESSDLAASALHVNTYTSPRVGDIRDEMQAISINHRNRTELGTSDNLAVSLSTDVRNKIQRLNQQHQNIREAGKPTCPSSNNPEHNRNLPKPKPNHSPTTATQMLSLQTSKTEIGDTVPEAESQQQQNKYQKQQRGNRESDVSLKSSGSEKGSSTTQGSVSETLSTQLYTSAELKPPDPENVTPLSNSETNGGYGESAQDTSERTEDHEEELGSNDMSASDSIEAIQPGTDFPNKPDNDTNQK